MGFLKRYIFAFSYPYKAAKVVFLDQTFEMDILTDLHVLKSPESEKNIFNGWFVCMLVCVSVISMTQKQITAEPSNLVFYACIISRCYLKFFIKIGQELCIQVNTKEF